MSDVQPGQMLGPYRIINQIGRGGMATVYKAYHASMDRYVAVKVLPRQFAEAPEFVGRFRQEARTIAKLEHPHILPVHDYGESEGITYLVMRFLDAGTLKERLVSGPLALGETDRMFTQLAESLGYAHANGVIHRDIKPSNALVDSRGDLFLTDFGIAKLVEGTAQFTATGSLIGTPAYMSPEQVRGEKLDQRSDIYSLGIVLYEMVIGQVPFEAETPLAVLHKHLHEPLPLPSTAKPDIAPQIERVLLKALAKDRDDRYASCAEFLAAWKRALAESQVGRAAAPAPGEVEGETVSGPPPALVRPAPLARAVKPTPKAPAAEAPAPPEVPAPRRIALSGWLLGVVVGAVVLVVGVLLGGYFSGLFRGGAPPSGVAPAEGGVSGPPAAATAVVGQGAFSDVSVQQISDYEIAVSFSYQIPESIDLSAALLLVRPDGCMDQLTNFEVIPADPAGAHSGSAAGSQAVRLSLARPGRCESDTFSILVLRRTDGAEVYSETVNTPISLVREQ